MLPHYGCKLLFSLWGYHVHTWGVLQVVAVIVFLYLAFREAKQRHLALRPWVIMVVTGTLMALLGMRLYNVFITKYQGLWQSLIRLVTFKGGIDSAGGILGVLWSAWYLKRKKLNIGRYLDTLAFPATVLSIIARVGCACALCETGATTSVPWALFYQDAARHPIALYYVASGIVMFGIFYWLRKQRFWDGFLITLFLLLYSFSRVVLDFFREVPPHAYYGLSLHQIAYLGIFLVSFVILLGKTQLRKI